MKSWPCLLILFLGISLRAQTYYFAATALNAEGYESIFSNEASCPATNRPVTLAWDSSPSTNVVGYRVWRGYCSRAYTTNYWAGSNLTLTVWPDFRIVTVSTVGATNLQSAANATGPWTKLNATNWSGTNPAGMKVFRAIGLHPPQITIRQIFY